MPEYLSPGVYVEEISTGPKPIEGVSTSTSGFVGRTERGPTQPRLVTSWLDYQRWFGSYIAPRDSFLPYAVEGFFQNGGKRAFIARVVAGGTATAGKTLRDVDGNEALQVQAIGSGVWGGNLLLRIRNGSRAEPGVETSPLFRVTILYYTQQRGDEPFVDPTDRASLSSPFYRAPSVQEDFDNLTHEAGAANNVLTVVNSASRLVRLLPVDEVAGLSARPANVEFGAAASADLKTGGGKGTLTLSALGPGRWGDEIEYKVTAGPSLADVEIIHGTLREVFEDLSGDPASADYFLSVLNGQSRLIRATLALDSAAVAAAEQAVRDAEKALRDAEAATPPDPAAIDAAKQDLADKQAALAEAKSPGLPGTGAGSLSDGSLEWFGDGTATEGVPTPGDFAGRGDVPPPERTGLAGLEAIDEISILVAPDEVNPGVRNSFQITQTVLNQCERLKDRFAVLSVARGQGSVQDIYPVRDTSYGALYYPWIRIFDHRTQDTLLVPPSGHVAGIYARSDTERGVHKAPANEVVRGIVTRDIDHQRGPLEYKLSRGEHDILNPRGINVIRDFRSDRRGIRVWGARTMSSDGEWKYVNVRRLFLFLEESIDEGTQWVVFEPNDQTTWERVVRSVANFLRRVWRDGALMGTTQDEAFFVRCDRNTMTQDDIDNGRLICYIGVAPVKPAEFVIFRISQKTLEATQ